MMKNILVFIFCLGTFACFSQQNLNIDYKPLKSQGLLPEIFTKPVKETVANEISDLDSKTDTLNNLKSNLFIESNYDISWEIKSGNTLLNDEITEYLNSIVDVILKDQPEIRKKIHVYTSKSPVVNAVTYYNGTVFVDLGLIAHAGNEAQVAFMLCHEISHYIKQHHIQGLIHTASIDATAEGMTSEDIFKEYCKYSKIQESEADSGGYVLMQATNYDVKQISNVFDILQYHHLPFELVEFDKSFFETENFKIPAKYSLEKVAPVKDNTDADDSESTHPNTSKRREAINKLIDPNSKGVNYIIGEKRFEYVRELARFEVCRLSLRYRDYNAALYSAYILSKKYPDNLFLIQTISKCLYAISLNHTGWLRYNKDSFLDGPIHYLEVESYTQQLYYLINKLPDNDWNIMSLNYVYRKHKKYPADQVLAAISDSLFNTMEFVNTQFETPGTENNFFVNENPIKDTASWKKYVFADLFSSDKEFTDKFPKTIGHVFEMPYTPKSYHVNNFDKKMRTVENIGIVLCLKPRYTLFYSDELKDAYTEADDQQKNLLLTISNCAKSQNFQLVLLDPGLIDSTEVNKLNDYSVIFDWLKERSDGEDNERGKVPVFNTDEIQEVANRYGTSHILRTGFVVRDTKVKQYVFYSVIYDIKQNKQVYVKQELFKGKPSKAVMQEKICALFNELKNGQ